MSNLINRLPSVQSEQLWIPCAERMPEGYSNVLCDDEGNVTIGYYIDDMIGWHDYHGDRIYPKYWMPLPEPYKEGQDD